MKVINTDFFDTSGRFGVAYSPSISLNRLFGPRKGHFEPCTEGAGTIDDDMKDWRDGRVLMVDNYWALAPWSATGA